MAGFTYERRLLVDNTSRKPCKHCGKFHPFFSHKVRGDEKCGHPVYFPDDADKDGPTISGGFYVSANRLSVAARLWLHGWRRRSIPRITDGMKIYYATQEPTGASRSS